MRPFNEITSKVVPVDRSNIDTDALIPKQFIKSIERTGFGKYLFDEWRFLDKGEPGMTLEERTPNPNFSLNMQRYVGAQILVARENFGCGSSREHAVWALDDFGIRVIIAPSFAEIFYANCLKNGILPIAIDTALVESLIRSTDAQLGYSLTVNLPTQLITRPDGETLSFSIDPYFKLRLENGYDDIDITLTKLEEISNYEKRRRDLEPWLFVD